ncbi:basic blue protein-like [Salvia miltiorrhiza]|uniref:basic blue protein-like n=1 Tax=Salvia miltiorrhiza TaxID=226208 RepID=UPI0025ABF985|nr:basic blue protein-like [Salvia miltiorrhiza]
MAKGRGSAIVVAMVIMGMLMLPQVAEAASYVVGGAGGWTFNVDAWPKGKRFKAGDTLVFNYNSGIHNMVAVDKKGYDSCSAPSSAKVYQSGKDQIKLKKGQSFFICSIAGHCQSGMKVAVSAS